jgi:VWFA-related protein
MHEITGFGIRNQANSRSVREVPVFSVIGRTYRSFAAIPALCLLSIGLAAQPQGTTPPDIPDAPSASRPFPKNLPPSQVPPDQTPPNQTSPDTTPPPANHAPPTGSGTTEDPVYAPGVAPVGATTATPGDQSSGNQDLYKIVTNVNQVLVPVMVKDDSGRLVNGLLSRDFAVFEDGKKQNLNFFTTDPFALSAAVLFDTGMQDVAVQKVIQTFSALQGAFSQFDEVSLYTYSTSVSKVTDFAAVGRKLEGALENLKQVTGRNNGPPVVSGPMGPQGPIVNGVPLDNSAPRQINPTKESHVLNDAIVAAALELRKRDRSRRKVIFIITDGREYGSNASYKDTLKVLLSNGIQVYGVAVEGSAVPVYGSLQKLHVPLTGSRLGYSNILPQYANATGGEIFSGFSRDAIETTYARTLGDARNQYTLGYLTHSTPSSTHREIEVRVARPDLKVTAKEGYYPVGLGR